jgi:phage terminase large subunit
MIAPYVIKSDFKHPIYQPFGGCEAFMYSKDPEVICSGPAETGKTLAACWKIHILASKYPGCQGAIVRKTQHSVYGSVLQTYQRVIAGAPVEAYGGEKPEKFNYANGSTIWIGGMDNSDKILSSERDFIYVNQAEELRLDDWEKLLTRATGRNSVIPHTQVIGDCNPSGSKHWIRQRTTLRLIPTTHKDNPTLYTRDGALTPQGERTMLILSGLTGVRRKRLLDGVWATAEGAVYDMFDSALHVQERDPLEMRTWYLAMDEGYTNPAVILLVGQDSDGRLHIMREFHQRGVLQKDVVARAGEWHRQYNASAVVDQAAAGLIADLNDAGIPSVGYKGRVLDGITTVQARLKVQGDGRSRLTVDPGCIETTNEFESYAWKPERDEPAKEFDHSMDAIRYLCGFVAGAPGPLPTGQPANKSKWTTADANDGWRKY